jgi:hypothetical protein
MSRRAIDILANALFVFYCTTVGIFLVLRPWAPPPLASQTPSGFARGFVSGLGVVHLVVAWLDARQFLRSGAAPAGRKAS